MDELPPKYYEQIGRLATAAARAENFLLLLLFAAFGPQYGPRALELGRDWPVANLWKNLRKMGILDADATERIAKMFELRNRYLHGIASMQVEDGKAKRLVLTDRKNILTGRWTEVPTEKELAELIGSFNWAQHFVMSLMNKEQVKSGVRQT